MTEVNSLNTLNLKGTQFFDSGICPDKAKEEDGSLWKYQDHGFCGGNKNDKTNPIHIGINLPKIIDFSELIKSMPEKLDKLNTVFDTNGDGKVDNHETKFITKYQELNKKMDVDGDGKVDNFEREYTLNKAFDKDGDGKLNDEEKAELEKYKQFDAKFKEKFDINDDGKLDEAEEKAMNTFLSKQAELAEKHQFDINEDGELDSAEKSAYQGYKSLDMRLELRYKQLESAKIKTDILSDELKSLKPQ